MSSGIKPIKLPARYPNLNAYAERWLKSVKNEIIDRQVFFGPKALSHSNKEYIAHFHHERKTTKDWIIPFRFHLRQSETKAERSALMFPDSTFQVGGVTCIALIVA